MLFSSLFRGGETRGNPARDPAMADLLDLGNRAAAGVAVNPRTAMRTAAVFACVSLISSTVGVTPLHLYRRRPDGSKERASDHPMYRLVRRSPNRWQTSMEFRQQVTMHMLLRGVGYARIVVSPRGQVSLVPLHADRLRAALLDDERLVYEYFNPAGRREVLLQSEVLRVPFMVEDGVTPVSPISCARDAIGNAIAGEQYAGALFKNDATPRGVLHHPGHFKDKESADRFKAAWRRAQSGENRGSTAVLEDGMKYEPIGMTNADAQFLELRKLSVSDVARIFLVPPHMIGDHEKGAAFASVEQQALDFVQHTMAAYFVRWEQALSRDLLSDEERQDDEYFFEFMVDGLLRGDIVSRYRAYAIGRQWGWLSANDIRIRENENKIDNGDEYLVPLNMASPGDERRPPGDQ